MKFSMRLLYLYLFSFVGLLVTVIGSIQLVDLGIRSVVFTDVDTYNYLRPQFDCVGENCVETVSKEEALMQARDEARKNRQRQLSSSLSMILIAAPLYLYHWRLIKKEK